MAGPIASPQEFAKTKKHAGWIGGSIDVRLEERADTYIDAADSSASAA